MKEKIYENGIEYILTGDYYLPNFELPTKKYHIGKYGMVHEEYIKEYHKGFYSNLILSGTLQEYLAEVDSRARNMVDGMIQKFANTQGVTEELKAKDQMKWVGLMNNIKAQAEEIVCAEIIYNREAL